MSGPLDIPDEGITVEELQYLMWCWERVLANTGYPELRFQSGRLLVSYADAVSHARCISHEAQLFTGAISDVRGVLLVAYGQLVGIMFSWGMFTLDDIHQRSAKWLAEMKYRATDKLTGQERAGVVDNAVGGPYPAPGPPPPFKRGV